MIKVFVIQLIAEPVIPCNFEGTLMIMMPFTPTDPQSMKSGEALIPMYPPPTYIKMHLTDQILAPADHEVVVVTQGLYYISSKNTFMYLGTCIWNNYEIF